jgi:serine/threonine-protein phosphatase 2A activator
MVVDLHHRPIQQLTKFVQIVSYFNQTLTSTRIPIFPLYHISKARFLLFRPIAKRSRLQFLTIVDMTSTTPPKLNALEVLDLSSPPAFTKPSKRINEGPDVARFLTSLAYRDIGVFILQLNRALCPRNQSSSPLPRTFPLNSKPPATPSVQTLQDLLAKIGSFIDEAPPDPGPRRFGNVSFRKWHAIFEERLDALLGEGLLGETLNVGDGKAKEEVSSYLLGGFGSVQRLDYGTGHELSFVAFLGCLWKLGFFKDGEQGGEIEREIVLKVIEPYVAFLQIACTPLTFLDTSTL